jgi:hypothetical protein
MGSNFCQEKKIVCVTTLTNLLILEYLFKQYKELENKWMFNMGKSSLFCKILVKSG